MNLLNIGIIICDIVDFEYWIYIIMVNGNNGKIVVFEIDIIFIFDIVFLYLIKWFVGYMYFCLYWWLYLDNFLYIVYLYMYSV